MRPFVSRALFGACLLLASPYTLAEDLWTVYQLALERDAQLQAAEAAYQAALEAKPQARSALLPQIAADASYSRSDRSIDALGSSTDLEPETTQWGISLSQSVYRHDYWVAYRQADSRVAQAKAEVEAARQDLIVRVSEAYFNLLGAEDNLRFARAEKEAVARQLEQAQKRFEVGLIAITDVKESQARYDQAVASEIEAVNTLDNAREALQVITGKYIETAAPLSEDMPLAKPEPQDMQAWVDTALEQNLQLAAARYAAEAARQEVARQRAGHYPYLDLTARYSDSSADQFSTILGEYNADTTDTTITLQATLPLFTGGYTSSRVREAQSGFQQAQSQLELQRRETVRQARASYLNVMADIASVQAFRRVLESNRTAAEATQAGFEVGTRTAVDVLLTLSNVYQGERDYASSRYQYVLNGLRLKQAAGTLSEEDIRQINRWIVQQ